jgi:hypothetical protein
MGAQQTPKLNINTAMKTFTKLTLTSLTAALLSTSAAFADSANWPLTNSYRSTVQTQPKTTVAFGGTARTNRQAPQAGAQRTLKQINTAHGTVTYFAE